MNRQTIRNKKANKVAKWIVESVLKLSDKSLITFYKIIESELKKRGIEDVRSCADFLD